MSQATRILLALVAGLALGIGAAEWLGKGVEQVIAYVQPIGTLWLNGLQMTVVPLVVALLVTGIASTAEAARAGRIAGRAIAAFVILLWASTILSALLTPLLLDLWPIPAGAANALKAGMGNAVIGPIPSLADFLTGIVPTNPIAAAAEGKFLPLIVFTTAFGFALTRLPPEPRQRLTDWFQAIVQVMLVIIGWVLWLAPLGVAALGFVVGARTGTAALGALLHYVATVSIIGVVVASAAFPLAIWGGRISLGCYARALLPAQAVALSTQSSLASLPAMLRGCTALGVPVATSGVVLPLAVALFRVTSPAMNLAVAIYVARWFGVPLTAQAMVAGVAVAAITTMGTISLPGTISFITSIAPIAMAMGVPVAPLALLVAAETFPDLFRTVGNVTMDIAVTAAIAARSGGVRASDDIPDAGLHDVRV